MAGFEPFSLAKSIQAGQQMKMNSLKIQSAQSEMARQEKLRNLAQMSQKPVYSPAEGPPEPHIGGQPEIQVGTQYDPIAHQQGAAAMGETELAGKLQDQISQMSEDQRKEVEFKNEHLGRLLFSAKGNPELWNQGFQEAVDAGYVTEDQYVPYSDQAWQSAMNETQKVKDLLTTGSSTKAPKTRSIREGREIVNQEWNSATKDWVEVGRGPLSEQQINLRNKPSEQAAGKDYQQILDQANTAEGQLITLNRARALLPEIDTGKLEPIKVWARQWGDALGIGVDTDKMSDAVSFNAVMKGAVLDGMKSIKGTASEADRKIVEDSVAAIENPKEANKFLINVSESLAKRTIERADFYDKWAQDHNASLLGARRAWSKHVNDTPLIRNVKGKYYHYYQFKDQMIAANKKAFANATPEEIESFVKNEWNK